VGAAAAGGPVSSPAICLRCDWSGKTSAETCPRCGARLYRDEAPPAKAGAGRAADRPADARSTAAPSPIEEPTPPEPPRSRPLAILGGVVVLAIIAVFVAFGAATTGAPPAGPAPWRPSGVIVFAAAGSHDRVLLWRWDLATGRYAPGPQLRGPVQLANAEAVAPGALGIVAGDTGSERASLLRIFGRADHPDPVLGGALVAWPPGGSVVVAASPSSGAGCAGSTIASVNVATGLRSRDLRVCGSVTGLGRAGVSTFFTVHRGGATRIDFVGFRRAHTVLRGYDLRAVSPATDLIVTPASGPTRDAALFWEGNRPRPVPYADADGPLLLREVLAWSSDSSAALVEGSLGGRAGVWSLLAGAGTDTGPRAPTPVLTGVRDAWASYAPDGTAYLVADARFYAYHEGSLTELARPDGMPSPSGPLVWLR